MKNLIETLRNANNEGTDSPYWLIIDPAQMLKPDADRVAGMITGIFFSREDAEQYLKSRKHYYSKRAVVYCLSGCNSLKYKNFYKEIKNEI